MKSILITGGTGHFARLYIRTILVNNEYERICVYSRDEAKQARMREEFNDDPRLRFFLGDVRDYERLQRAMHGVHHVIHSAAQKRIEACFYNGDEAVKTNIIGSMNVVNACAAAKVSKAILLSTDKAYQPVSIYGHTKAVAESIFLSGNNIYGLVGPVFGCVRYGNIWNSTFSIVPKWKSIIAAGCDTVPVTDPNATRFFMTTDEAVKLVQDAIAYPKRDVIIPDWLPAYRVGDLAEAMGVKMKITGLPEFEKMHESMRDGLSSDVARRMTIEELKDALSRT